MQDGDLALLPNQLNHISENNRQDGNLNIRL